MVTEERLRAVYKDYPQLLANTQMIIDSCDFKYDFEIPKIKHYTNSESDIALLTTLAHQGMEWRYGKIISPL
jgi:DNA polymerase-3 subunit alpha/error-prone DNA polymerase